MERPCVGVVGGDLTCVRVAINRWTGRKADRVLSPSQSFACVSDAAGKRDIGILLSLNKRLEPWPGGPLIWLYPERGPSEPELAQMRSVMNAGAVAEVRVLLCLPRCVQPEQAGEDLDTVAHTLGWAVESDIEIDLEAVWLDGNQRPSMNEWLAALG